MARRRHRRTADLTRREASVTDGLTFEWSKADTLLACLIEAGCMSHGASWTGSISKDAMVLYLRTMERQIDAALIPERLLTTLSRWFAGIALLLACVGLYGVMAYNVSRRRREIGLRMALGDVPRAILSRVLREAVMVWAIGVVIGLSIGHACALDLPVRPDTARPRHTGRRYRAAPGRRPSGRLHSRTPRRVDRSGRGAARRVAGFTCAGRVSRRMSASARRSIWCGRSVATTGVGRSRIPIQVRCTSRRPRRRAEPLEHPARTPCAGLGGFSLKRTRRLGPPTHGLVTQQ
jgi:hypothetical protein